jgi:hypothetical protein
MYQYILSSPRLLVPNVPEDLAYQVTDTLLEWGIFSASCKILPSGNLQVDSSTDLGSYLGTLCSRYKLEVSRWPL